MTAVFPVLPVANVLFAFETSNFAGKVIVVGLFVGSMLTWSLMLAKARELRDATNQTAAFLARFRRGPTPLSALEDRRPFARSPAFVIYEEVCKVLAASVAAGDDPAPRSGGTLRAASIRSTADRVVADQALLLENYMGLLATGTTTAPLLGLLGTVWGVMDSFSAISLSGAGTAMLSQVAPGISGALLTTVVGLLVAMPSAIGYNLLSDRIRKLTVAMDNFGQELCAEIENHYELKR